MCQSCLSNPIKLDVASLFDNNRAWANNMLQKDPLFFASLGKVHAPEFLWIGCSDARVPANELIGLQPGEVFVHRNIANQVLAADMNCQSVVEYAVEVLKVKHIVIMGHYDCGGVKAAIQGGAPDMVDHWIRPIRKLYHRSQEDMQNQHNDQGRINRLVELNVIEQVKNLAQLPSVRRAWEASAQLMLHGWVYGIENGIIKDLGVTVDSIAMVQSVLKET
jgi:carbonic anhydrase